LSAGPEQQQQQQLRQRKTQKRDWIQPHLWEKWEIHLHFVLVTGTLLCQNQPDDME
jgi:hypothetical protein